MKTPNRFNLTLINIIIFIIIVIVSAGWVIASSVQQAKPQNPQGTIQNPQQTVPAPSQTPKYFGIVGRPDPFIAVQEGAPSIGAAAAMPGRAQGEPGASAGPVLTGTFFANGSRYAIIKSGNMNFILKKGDEKFGFKVVQITGKKVIMQNKEGKSELKLGDYVFSRARQNQPQGPAGKLPQAETLIPPPMQAPVQAESVPAQTQQIPTEPNKTQPAQQPVSN